MYSSTVASTGELERGGPGHFTSWKEAWYPLYRRLAGRQGWLGWVQKISPLLRFEPQTIQPVGSHYTDCYSGCCTYKFF